MKSGLATLLLASILAVPAVAEHPLAPDLRRGLESDDPKTRAWAAHDAGKDGIVDVVPALAATLRNEAARPPAGRNVWAVRSCLGALVHLRGVVTEETLAPHLEDETPACLAIMAVMPVAYRKTLVRVFEGEDAEYAGKRWLGAGNLLAQAGCPDFAERLLRGFTARLDIRVLPSEGEYRGSGGCITWSGFTRPPPEGFPPVPRFTLDDDEWDREGATRVLEGPHPVYVLEDRYGSRCGGVDTFGDDDVYGPQEAREAWLADLLGPESPGLPTHKKADLRWGGEPPLRRDTRREAEKVAGRYWEVVADLVLGGLIEKRVAATLSARIMIRYRDCRSDRSRPIPKTAELTFPCPWKPKRPHRVSPADLVF